MTTQRQTRILGLVGKPASKDFKVFSSEKKTRKTRKLATAAVLQLHTEEAERGREREGSSWCSAVCVLGKSKGNYNDNWHIILNSWQPVEAKSFRLFRVNSHFPIGKWKMRNGKENCRTAGGRQRETETERARKTAEFSTACRDLGKKVLRWGKKLL